MFRSSRVGFLTALALVAALLGFGGGEAAHSAALTGAAALASPGKTPRVLLIGVDGLQYEQLLARQQAGEAPNFSRLKIFKGYTGGIQGGPSEQATMSGGGWATLLTGTWFPRHGVPCNDCGSSAADGVWKRLRAVNPAANTVSVVSWNSINDNMFSAQAGSMTYRQSTGENDAAVEAAVIQRLQTTDPDLLFAHLDKVDTTGHQQSFGPAYNAAIVETDARLGRILDAVEARAATKPNEDWLIMAVTDHGRGLPSGNNHGGQTESEKTIFVASNKPMNAQLTQPVVPANTAFNNLYGHASAADVTPTVLAWLGALPAVADYTFDGIPLIGPLAVRQLAATPRGSQGKVSLSWQNGGRSFGSLRVYREGKLLATLAGDAQSYVDSTVGALPPGPLKLNYVVEADGASAAVLAAFDNTPPPPFDSSLVANLENYYDFQNGLVDTKSGATLTNRYGGSTASTDRLGKTGLGVDAFKGSYAIPRDISATSKTYTIGFWMKTAGAFNDASVLANKNWGSGGNVGVAIGGMGGNTLKFNIGDGAGHRADGYLSYRPNVWVYVALAVDQTAKVMRGYVADPQAGTDPQELVVNFSNVTGNVVPSYGQWSLNEDGTGQYYLSNPGQRGLVEYDDVAVWSTALSRSQIASISSSARPLGDLLQPAVPGFDGTLVQDLRNYWALDAGLVDDKGTAPLKSLYSGNAEVAGAFGGKALSIDATLGHYAIPEDVSATQSRYTIGFWMNTPGAFSDASVLANKDWGTGRNVGVAIGGMSGNSLKFNIGDGSNRADGFLTYTPNTWVYVALAVDRDAKIMRAYVCDPAKGGVQEKQVSFANVVGNVVPSYGRWALNEDGTGNYYARYPAQKGVIAYDDVAVWNSALTKAQIAAIYGAARPLMTLKPF